MPAGDRARLPGHGQLRRAGDGARERYRDRHALPLEPERDPDAHHARGERRAGPDHRREGERGAGPGRGPAAAARASASSTAPAAPSGGPRRTRRSSTRSRRNVRPDIPVDEIDANINDPAFADRAAGAAAGDAERSNGAWHGSEREPAIRCDAPLLSDASCYGGTDALHPSSRCWSGCAPRSTAGRPIVGAGAGTGISAKFAEAGGADLIIIYNSGRFRMAGHGSLAGAAGLRRRQRRSSRRWASARCCRSCATRR